MKSYDNWKTTEPEEDAYADYPERTDFARCLGCHRVTDISELTHGLCPDCEYDREFGRS